MDQTDEQIMSRYQTGDQEALQELFQRYKTRIFHFCLGLLGNRADAEEAAGEAFLALVAHGRTFDPTRTFSTWLYTVARNKCVNHLRKRMPLMPLWKPNEEEEDAVGVDLPDVHDPAWRRMATQELSVRIRRAIGELPTNQRTALILRQYHSFSYEEIGRIMRCSLSNVKKHLMRGPWSRRHPIGSAR